MSPLPTHGEPSAGSFIVRGAELEIRLQARPCQTAACRSVRRPDRTQRGCSATPQLVIGAAPRVRPRSMPQRAATDRDQARRRQVASAANGPATPRPPATTSALTLPERSSAPRPRRRETRLHARRERGSVLRPGCCAHVGAQRTPYTSVVVRYQRINKSLDTQSLGAV
jgi:hypothetical protein